MLPALFHPCTTCHWPVFEGNDEHVSKPPFWSWAHAPTVMTRPAKDAVMLFNMLEF